jgi:demethylsterigmatocystin 6-O-methyltransferase
VVHSPFQIAHQTDLPAFVWAGTRPDLVADFNLWMSTLHQEAKTWLDVYDFGKHCAGFDPQGVVFVDVGGGIGQKCALLKKKIPDLPGRVVLQDMAHAIPHAIPTPEVENTIIDMWDGQPVKGKLVLSRIFIPL